MVVLRGAAIRRLLVVVALVAGLAGCGKVPGDEGKRVPVTGRVSFKDGKPLTRGVVVFWPDASKGNASQHEPRGEVDAQGNYKLATSPRLEGVLPGWYKVAIVAQEPFDENDPYKDPPWLINRRFGNRDKSGLAVEVIERAEPGRYDFQVSK
jgi:hypothetical protein